MTVRALAALLGGRLFWLLSGFFTTQPVKTPGYSEILYALGIGVSGNQWVMDGIVFAYCKALITSNKQGTIQMRALLLAVSLSVISASANAILIQHTVTFTETSPVSGTTYVGTFAVEDSLLVADTFIPFDDFDSFSITIQGKLFDLTGVEDLLLDGVTTNAAGAIVAFDGANGDDGMADINQSDSQLDMFPDLEWFAVLDLSSGGDGRNGTYVIEVSSSSIPEPTTLALMTLGIAGIGFSRKRAA